MARELTSYKKKAAFIKAINNAFKTENETSVTGVEYQVFYSKEHDCYQEFLVVTYRGGAIAARNVNINSDAANFAEIGKLIYGGYYEEVEWYRSVRDTWERVI